MTVHTFWKTVPDVLQNAYQISSTSNLPEYIDIFLRNITESARPSLLSRPEVGHPNDVNLDSWGTVRSSDLHHWKMTFFHFESRKYAGRKTSLFLLKRGSTVLRIYRNHFFKKDLLFSSICSYECLSVWVYTLQTNAHGIQERELDPLKLELQTVGNHPIWFWELNPAPLQERYMVFTAEPASDPADLNYSNYYYPDTLHSLYSDCCLESSCSRQLLHLWHITMYLFIFIRTDWLVLHLF